MAKPTELQIIEAASVILPLLQQAKEQAEKGGLTGKAKNKFINDFLRTTYSVVQKSGSVPALGFVPWEAVAPLIVPVTSGAVSLVKGLFGQLGVDDTSVPGADDLLPTPKGISVQGNVVMIGAEAHTISISPDGEKVYFNTKD